MNPGLFPSLPANFDRSLAPINVFKYLIDRNRDFQIHETSGLGDEL